VRITMARLPETGVRRTASSTRGNAGGMYESHPDACAEGARSAIGAHSRAETPLAAAVVERAATVGAGNGRTTSGSMARVLGCSASGTIETVGDAGCDDTAAGTPPTSAPAGGVAESATDPLGGSAVRTNSTTIAAATGKASSGTGRQAWRRTRRDAWTATS
jgi:hypothetical protein